MSGHTEIKSAHDGGDSLPPVLPYTLYPVRTVVGTSYTLDPIPCAHGGGRLAGSRACDSWAHQLSGSALRQWGVQYVCACGWKEGWVHRLHEGGMESRKSWNDSCAISFYRRINLWWG